MFYKQWSVSLEIYPSGILSGWSSILHVGTGGDYGVYGDRNPGIWFTSGTTKLHIACAVNGDRSYPKETDAIPLNEWTKVDIAQIRQSDGYHYTIAVDYTIILDIINTDPRDYTDVKVSSALNEKIYDHYIPLFRFTLETILTNQQIR